MQKAKYWKKYWKLFLSLPTSHDIAMSPPRKVSDIFTHSSWRMSELNVYFYKINYMSSLKCSIRYRKGTSSNLFSCLYKHFHREKYGEKVDDVPCRYFRVSSQQHVRSHWAASKTFIASGKAKREICGGGGGSIPGAICLQISNETSQ